MDITKIIEAIKLSSSQLFAFFLIIALAATVLVFAPSGILEAIGVTEIPPPLASLPGISLIISSVGIIVTGFILLSLPVRRIIGQRGLSKRRIERLHSLTPGERRILSRYIENKTRTQWIRLDNGVARQLVIDGIIFQSSDEGHVLNGFPHNIQLWAWDYLNKHPYLVSDNAASDEK